MARFKGKKIPGIREMEKHLAPRANLEDWVEILEMDCRLVEPNFRGVKYEAFDMHRVRKSFDIENFYSK